MALDTAKRKQVIYFIGDEIENTVAKGFRTLFVVGISTVSKISIIYILTYFFKKLNMNIIIIYWKIGLNFINLIFLKSMRTEM